MGPHDPLLGQPRRDKPKSSKIWIGVLFGLVGLVIAVLIFTTKRVSVESVPAKSDVPARNASAPNALPRKQSPPPDISPSTEVAFRLKPIQEEDQRKLGIGCACSFSLKSSSIELLIAGGDDLAIFRPNGSQRICTLQKDDMQAMFDGDARIDCGSARLTLHAYGPITPGFDGQGSSAKLTVLYDGSERTLDGHLGCAC